MKRNERTKISCPCCGYKTFDAKPYGSYVICPVCYWEDDLVQLEDPNYKGGANHVSLKQAQKNFIQFGASEKVFIPNVRQPTKEEARDVDWKPI